MDTLFAVALWSALSSTGYTYLGYPLLIAAWARVHPRPVRKQEVTRRVAVVVAAWNEADVLEARIANLLTLDYPADQLVILVGSDGSDDGTHEILAACRDPRLIAYPFAERRGKPSVLNDLVASARDEHEAEIIVFGDARQSFAPDAVRQLVSNFADPEVGSVSGKLVFRSRDDCTAQGIGAYWRYELFLRRCESAVGSMLGATGAIYAVRASLFRPLPPDVVLDDMYTPLGVVAQGYRAVLDGEAEAYDNPAATVTEEWRRKVRTLYGNFQIFFLHPRLLVPGSSPVGWQMISHKLLRVSVPVFLIVALAANVPLALGGGLVYRGLMAGQLAFYGAAAAGAALPNCAGGGWLGKVVTIPHMFCVLNAAALAGLWRFLTGRQSSRWKKARAK